MTRLIIVRHGQTEWNTLNRVQGLRNNPLSPEGESQAHRLGRRLKDERIDVIYTSTLRRAIHTAEAVAAHHPAVEIRKCPELNEMDWGVWEGLTFGEIEERYPDQLERRDQDKFNFAPEEGESPADLERRLIPFLKEIVRRHNGKTVLIVGHGGINRVIMGIILEWPPEKTATVKSGNTSVSIIEVKESASRMHLFNCKKHLEERLE